MTEIIECRDDGEREIWNKKWIEWNPGRVESIERVSAAIEYANAAVNKNRKQHPDNPRGLPWETGITATGRPIICRKGFTVVAEFYYEKDRDYALSRCNAPDQSDEIAKLKSANDQLRTELAKYRNEHPAEQPTPPKCMWCRGSGQEVSAIDSCIVYSCRYCNGSGHKTDEEDITDMENTQPAEQNVRIVGADGERPKPGKAAYYAPTNESQCSDYGEPWRRGDIEDNAVCDRKWWIIFRRIGRITLDNPTTDRIISCVNAMQGIADPAKWRAEKEAEIAALRDHADELADVMHRLSKSLSAHLPNEALGASWKQLAGMSRVKEADSLYAAHAEMRKGWTK